MFDRTYVTKGSTEFVPYEKTIIEKRAPTDDSIRLYEEIKEKAYKSILFTLEMKDNILNVTAIIYTEPFGYKKMCKYVVILNGQKLSGVVEVPTELYRDKSKIMQAIYKEVSERIALEVIKHSKEESWRST